MPKKELTFKKGRGVQFNSFNKYQALHSKREFTDADKAEMKKAGKTTYIDIFPKTIVNNVDSPHVGKIYSLNPYQGCEHGCVYCYARNSHQYWGYSSGLDFEQKILVKRNAPQLLENHLKNKRWKAAPVMMSGNTDCYQPIEKKTHITRNLLKVFYKYRHPVQILTKNALIQRDEDVLADLAKHNLICTLITITSLKEEIRWFIEPRTATSKKKLKVIERFAQKGIPVGLMLGPIIPGLTNYEIFDVIRAAAEHGAQYMTFTVLHLNGHLAELFTDWVQKIFPLKADHILSLVRQCHAGRLNDSRPGLRSRGDGEIAHVIHRQIKLARSMYLPSDKLPMLNLSLHRYHKTGQMSLFG